MPFFLVVDLTNKIGLALSLFSYLKVFFDEGVIAIVPAAGDGTSPRQWRCVVLDESKNEDVVWQSPGGFIWVKVRSLNPAMESSFS